MQIENSSNLNFGMVPRIPAKMDLKILKTVQYDLTKFTKLLQKQAINDTKMKFFYDSKNNLFADISYGSYNQVFKKGFLTNTFDFFKKMCKIAEDVQKNQDAATFKCVA